MTKPIPIEVMLRRREYKSKLEAEYSRHLDHLVSSGGVLTWHYEDMKFRLGPNTTYLPDFIVIALSQETGKGEVWAMEVKGSWRAPHQDKSRVKLKACSERYPWIRWWAVTKKAGEWRYEEVR